MMRIKENEEYRIRVIEEINEARTDPKEYAKKIRHVKKFFKGKLLKIPEEIPIMTTEGESAFEEAAEYLEKQQPIKPVKFSKGLTNVSQDAIKKICRMSDIEEVNNIDLESIIDKYGKLVGEISQAVDFGSSSPELVVINLIVDDGDKSRGNRMNIMNPKFKLVGVSTSGHKTYLSCTVIMYARYFFRLDEEIGNISADEEEVYEPETKPIKERPRNFSVVRKSSLLNKVEDFGNLINDIVESRIKFKYMEVTVKEEENIIETPQFKSKVGPKFESNVSSTAKSKENTSETKYPVCAVAENEDDDDDLPEDVLKIEKSEKIVEDSKGVKSKIIKKVIYKEDGTILTEKVRVKL